MGQIVQNINNQVRCNLAAIQTGGSQASTVLAAGEVWLVDTTNASKGTGGYGSYDSYIIGDGTTAASALEVKQITPTDEVPTAGSSNLVTSGGVAKELGDILMEGENNVSTSETTNIIATTTIAYTLKAGTKLYIEVEGISSVDTTQPARTAYMLFNGTNTRHSLTHTQDYILEEDVSKIRVAVTADGVRVDGGHVSVKIYLKGIKQEIASINEFISSLNTDVEELQEIQSTVVAISNAANGVVLGSEETVLEDVPSGNTPILSLTGLNVPAGRKIRMKVEGIGTVVSAYMYKINNGSFVQNNIEEVNYVNLENNLSSISIVIPPSYFIQSGTVTAEVDVYGVSTGIIEDVDSLKEKESINETAIHQDSLKAFGGNLGSYNDVPISVSTVGNMIVIKDSLPANSKIAITTEGIGTAVSGIIYSINNGAGTIINKSYVEIFSEEVINKLEIYSTSSQIIDATENVNISVDYIGLLNNVESIETEIQSLKDTDYTIVGADIFSYNEVPVKGNYINTSGLNYPAGKYRLTVEGIGTAISSWSYALNGTSYTLKKYSSIEYDLTELTALRIWTASSQIIDMTKNVKFNVRYIGLSDEITEIKSSINSNGVLRDFHTEDIINDYATDVTNKSFDNTFSFIVNSDSHVNKNMIVSAYAKYVNNTDDSVPTIQFLYMYGSTTVYTSTAYTIGKKGEYCHREWRVPAFKNGCSVQVTVTVPANVTLYIDEISNRYSDFVVRDTVGYRMNAHISFYNFNTYNAWTESAKLGYPCAIVVPKRTSDGIWVCFHDDSLTNQLIDANGHTPADNHPGESLAISSLTFAELQTYTYTANSFGEKLKVSKLEDFFMVCAKTGMHPMFSWHPVSSAENMQEVKAMAIKFGILPYLNIKMNFNSGDTAKTYMTRAYTVFGDAIESYTGDVNTDESISEIISNLDSIAFDKTRVRVGLELFDTRLGNDTSKVQAILNAGYFAAIAWMNNYPTGEQLEYWIKNGVTEFTDYRMTSYGLNW